MAMPPVFGNEPTIMSAAFAAPQLMHNQRDMVREGTGGSLGAAIVPIAFKLDEPISLRLCINQ